MNKEIVPGRGVGTLCFGITEQDAVQILGDPAAVIHSSAGLKMTFFSQGMTLLFSKENRRLISIDLKVSEESWPTLHNNPVPLGMQDFMSAMGADGVRFSLVAGENGQYVDSYDQSVKAYFKASDRSLGSLILRPAEADGKLIWPSLEEAIALIDLDGSVVDYDSALKARMRDIQAPNELPYQDRYTGGEEPPHIEARRKLIQGQPGFWRGLEWLPLGREVVGELRRLRFTLEVLTKGPQKNGLAWKEKLEWSVDNIPDASVTVTGKKHLHYGKLLYDDFPPYFTEWLVHRPRGLVVCLAQPWNEEYAKGGSKERPDVFRFDGSNVQELRTRLRTTRERPFIA